MPSRPRGAASVSLVDAALRSSNRGTRDIKKRGIKKYVRMFPFALEQLATIEKVNS
jgi:hypothetical protein